jgi:hypothetical protein
MPPIPFMPITSYHPLPSISTFLRTQLLVQLIFYKTFYLQSIPSPPSAFPAFGTLPFVLRAPFNNLHTISCHLRPSVISFPSPCPLDCATPRSPPFGPLRSLRKR